MREVLRRLLATERGVSLRLRLILGTSVLAVLFMPALLPALRVAFVIALEQSIEKRLAADGAALVSAARSENGQLQMPDQLPDEEFENLEATLLGMIYDRAGALVWHLSSVVQQNLNYIPRYDGRGHEFLRVRNAAGEEFFIYDVEVDLLRGQSAAFSIITLQPASEYQLLYNRFNNQLQLWAGRRLASVCGTALVRPDLGFRSLRGLSAEVDQVEAGGRDSLSEQHPRELLRLIRSLNRLLDSERQQSERYRHSLYDLAHSLKTPLAVLQSVSEVIASQPHSREQAQVLQSQVERMNQQIGYQLQRASLRKSGLMRHRVMLVPLLDTLIGALDKVCRDKQVQLSRDFPPQLWGPMEQGALLELLGNLLENAYRLCLGQVRISAELQGHIFELRVEDDGPGVPSDQRERILQRGERLDTQHPGQGIGTAVVKDIIESYSGELLLEDSALGGACFRVRLYD